MKEKLLGIVALISVCTGSNPIYATQDSPLNFLCGNISGFYIGPHSHWRPKPDGLNDVSVLIEYKPGSTLSHVVSFRNGKKVYEGSGLGLEMNGGFSVTVWGKEYLESYVVNISTLELFLTMIRSGSARLPNSEKAFHGSCKPAGSSGG